MATKWKDILLSFINGKSSGGEHWLTKSHQRHLDNDSLIQFKSHIILFTLTNEQAGQYGKYRVDLPQSLSQ